MSFPNENTRTVILPHLQLHPTKSSKSWVRAGLWAIIACLVLTGARDTTPTNLFKMSDDVPQEEVVLEDSDDVLYCPTTECGDGICTTSVDLCEEEVAEEAPQESPRVQIVLIINSHEGDDALARMITALIRAAPLQSGWVTHRLVPSLVQIELVYGCNSRSVICLERIANQLEADQIIFGEMRRVGEAEYRAFELEIQRYDFQTNDVIRTSERYLPLDPTPDEIMEVIQLILQDL